VIAHSEASMARSAADLLAQNYGLVAKDLFTPLLDVFGAARSAFDGDIEKAVVLLEVAVRTMQDPSLSHLDLKTVLSGTIETYPSRSTNMRSIADSSGNPKETVRRKVAALVQEGLVLREGNNLSLSTAATPVLTPVREAVLKLAARNYDAVAGLQNREDGA
jgi:hypothetical protein